MRPDRKALTKKYSAANISAANGNTGTMMMPKANIGMICSEIAPAHADSLLHPVSLRIANAMSEHTVVDSIEKNRTPMIDTPNTILAKKSKEAVPGGWSLKPRARCLLCIQ